MKADRMRLEQTSYIILNVERSKKHLINDDQRQKRKLISQQGFNRFEKNPIKKNPPFYACSKTVAKQ